ncbi:hypothetical protein CR161_10475 [Prosthecochloris sp. ZM]|uniref:hypothetical protein n=1 Tax=Prosthecochloris sp. ZM TaxID=2283143 RepID=UPI000DF82024|nr:hypothetical protein [Prosthecochloris sp. ZM]RDD31088.1 hypothetical protein CR161_10475 [Prosthecochloris sp. ZM]
MIRLFISNLFFKIFDLVKRIDRWWILYAFFLLALSPVFFAIAVFIFQLLWFYVVILWNHSLKDIGGVMSYISGVVWGWMVGSFARTTVVDWLIAIGTIGAVIVALFKDSVLRYWRRPILNVEMSNENPYCISVPQFDYVEESDEVRFGRGVLDEKNSITESYTVRRGDATVAKRAIRQPNTSALYIGLKVFNTGKSVAEHVEVYAKELRCMDRLDDGPWPLAMDLVWGNTGDSFYPKIHPHIEKYCNIGFIYDPKGRKHNHQYYFSEDRPGKYKAHEPALYINVAYPLARGDHIVGPGRYEIDLAITAEGADLLEKTVQIEFRDWHDDEKTMLRSITCRVKE